MRRRDYEPSTLRTYCRLKVCVYKKARQGGIQSKVMVSVSLWSCMFEDRLQKVVSGTAKSRVRGIANMCGLQNGCKQIEITKK